MQVTPRTAITIPSDRQRKEFDPTALHELAETIRAKGLMHAPVMRETPQGLTLVAGERRIRAIELLWQLGGTLRYNGTTITEGNLPYVTLGQLSPLEAEEAELEENLHRKDLSWQENSAAMAKLHRIRSAQAQSEGRVHTVADTAMETKGRSDGSYQEAVRKDLIVAKYLDNPEVAKAKDANEAFKILKRQEETAKHIANARAVGTTFTKSAHRALNVDCLSWMLSCPEGTFDVILTDPPYGMNAQSFGNGEGRMDNRLHQYDDSPEHWTALMSKWAPLSYAVAKPEAHAYVFCDLDHFHELKAMMSAAGWYVFRTPIISNKPNSGRVPLPDQGPRRNYELILYAIKGKKKTTAIYPDVITSFQDSASGHGAQKPISLFVDLLRRSVRPGDKVLDSFSGSGTIFDACHQLKVEATGLELSSEYFAMGYKRLTELDQPGMHGDGAALGNELKAMMGR